MRLDRILAAAKRSRFLQTSRRSPATLTALLDGATFLSAGHNGVAFREQVHGHVVKVSWLVFEAVGYLPRGFLPDATQYYRCCSADSWSRTLTAAGIERAVIERAAKEIVGLGYSPPVLEALGVTLVEKVMPHVATPVAWVSEDGMALARPYAEGKTLYHLLTDGDPQMGPDQPVWGRLAKILRAMLRLAEEYGVIVDVVNPGNFVFDSTYGSLRLIDTETVRVDAQARAYFWSAYKLKIPTPPGDLPFSVVWPWVPEQIAQSKLWPVTLAQAVALLRNFHTLREQAAIQRIAEMPRFAIKVNPLMEDTRLIYAARARLS